MFSSFQIFNLASHKNPSPLAFVLRLCNIRPCLSFLLSLIVGSKLCILHRKHPSEWKEVILIWELISQGHKIQPKQVFASKHMHTRIVVDLLEEMHFNEDVRIYGEVGPINIPISSIVALLDFPF